MVRPHCLVFKKILEVGGGKLAHHSMQAPSMGLQQHASRVQADPSTPTHMPGGTLDLGECGLISKKILEVWWGTLAHESMHAPSVGVQQHASRAQADLPTPPHMPGATMDLG